MIAVNKVLVVSDIVGELELATIEERVIGVKE